MKYAYDFGLPEGTEVRTAAGGIVAHARGDVTSCGGYDQRNTVNYVTINHGDGSATLYLHLKKVWVAVGQTVQQGQPIGLSGKTGWTDSGSGCYPHLHFQRQEQGIWITNSRPVYFDEYPGRQFNAGDRITSQNGTAPQPPQPTPTPTPPPAGCSNPPNLISPVSGTTVNNRSVTFTWNPPSGCSPDGYTIHINTGSNPEGQPMIKDTGVGPTSYTYTFGQDGTFYWHVRACKPCDPYQPGPWGSRSFTINTTPPPPPPPQPEPGIPTLLSPPDDYTAQVNQRIDFLWSNTGASQYKFEAWNDTGPGSISVLINATSDFFWFDSPGSWRWQVRSIRSNGQPGDAPHTRSFTVTSEPPPTSPTPTPPDNTPPPPADGGTPTQVAVQAIQPWTDTGLDLNQGDEVTITASGIIKIAGSDSGKTPAGAGGTNCGLSDSLAQHLPCWSLIGSVGGRTTFAVGTGMSFLVNSPGRLYLGVNDDVFADNSGSWTATITLGTKASTPNDLQPPIVNWIAPTLNERVYELGNQVIQLGVNAMDNIAVSKVVFYRWDAVNQSFVNIGDVYTVPYQVSLDGSTLNYGWNHIFAEAYDTARNRSERKWILLNRSRSTPPISTSTSPGAPHDPNPPNGAQLGYQTNLTISVQGDGDQFRIHVWGTNYDRWRDWDSSRSLNIDGLRDQTYFWQEQARNSAGPSPWSDQWSFSMVDPNPPRATITVEPNNARPGQIVTLTASGFRSYVSVTAITIDGLDIMPYPSPVTDTNGDFTVQLIVPLLEFGPHTVIATVGDAGRTTASTIFTLTSGVPTVGPVSPATALAPLGPKLVRVWGFDATASAFQLFDPAALAVSDLKELQKGQGYWIRVTEATLLTTGGYTYQLVAGWNLIGWLGVDS